MPLSRYEIRSEYSLANPDLYRVADKDDPEGLLEGVAMAGLVGIIRQLGDLAEFAAEVFHDLHEDVLSIAARGHELLLRVRQLETEAPLIEKMMITKIDNGKCFYYPGLEWHANIYNDQNHFTQGDLPRFIRSAYEDCRSPPRLFPLDRFDVAGVGSCLKRFSDPSFFKTEWASSELMKAEKEQRDQKARRMKRKCRRQAYGEAREAKLASHIQQRALTEVENIETSRSASSLSDSSFESKQEAGDSLMQENDGMLLASGLLVSEQEGLQARSLAAQDVTVNEPSLDLMMEHSTTDMARHMDMGVLEDLKVDEEIKMAVSDDSASETDNFMDAVTTMDSEVETDSEMQAGAEVVSELLVELKEVKAPAPLFSEPPTGADEKHDVVIEDKQCFIVEDDKIGLVIEGDITKGNPTSEESSNMEQFHFAATSPKGFAEAEDRSPVDGDVIATSVQGRETSTSSSGSGTEFPVIGEDTVSRAEGHLLNDTPAVFPVEEEISVVVQTAVMLAVKDNLSSLISRSNASSPGLKKTAGEIHLHSESNAPSRGLEEDSDSNSERHLQSESTSRVLETPENLVRDEDLLHSNQLPDSDVPCEDLPSSSSPKGFDQLPESNIPGYDIPQSNLAKDFGAVPNRRRWQINKFFTKGFLASDLERDNKEVSESEQSESPRKRSLQSSPSSSIEPMKWVIDSTRTYLTDDELEDMQVSSASPSSSSSTLSSPRPATLTTTLLTTSSEHKPQKSDDSSVQSLISSSLKSGTKLEPYESAERVESNAEPLLSPDLGHSANSSPHSSSSAAQPFFDPLPSLAHNVNTSCSESLAEAFSDQSHAADNLEIFPPPPPLPPLAWRMTRSTHGTVVNSSKPMESSTSEPINCNVQASSDDLLQMFTSSTTMPMVPQTSSVKHSEPTHTFSSPTTGKHTFQKSELMLDESSTYETGLSDLETLHGRSADLVQVSKPAESHDRGPPSFLGMVERGKISVSEKLDLKGENNIVESPDTRLEEKFIDDGSCVTSSSVLQTEGIPARLDDSRLESQTKGWVEDESTALQRSELPHVSAPKLERKDFSEGTTSHDLSRLKKRSTWAWTSSTASSDDREVLLDQIRTRSFSLRNTSSEKLAPSRPVTNINVAAILEKANAIRQAFAGSDEDDDEEWSD